MEMSVLERILLLNLLPKEGSFNNLKLLREAKEALSFSDEENKLLNFTTSDEGRVMWTNPDSKPLLKEITFSDYITLKIVEELRALDAAEKLTDNHTRLYEHFVLPKEKEKSDG